MGPTRRTAGGALAALAAVAFGLVVPFTKRAGRDVGPFFTAAVLYGGAALFAAAMAALRRGRGPALRRRDAGRVVLVAVLGAAIAPTLLAWGLQRAAGTTAALFLNFEAVFTVFLARLVWRERLGRHVTLAVSCMTAGGALLVQRATARQGSTVWGALAIVVATAAWASENVLSRPLSERDAFQVVLAKSSIGAALTGTLAWATHDRGAPAAGVVALAACGAAGYGLSLALYLRAQRQIGAARTASIFALAPFAGALAAWALGDRALTGVTACAAILFAAGAGLHLTERDAPACTRPARG